MRKLLVVLGVLVFGAWCLNSTVSAQWAAVGYEDDPADGDPAGEGAARIREAKEETRYRGEVEHEWGTISSTDNGLHRVGSGRCFYAATVPANLLQADWDPDLGAAGGTALNAVESGTGGATERGEGRCWIDNDGPMNSEAGAHALSVWDTASNTFNPPYARAISGGHNLLTNGSFEQGACGGAADPQAWTSTNLTISYGDPTDVTEGPGCEVNATATAGPGTAILTQELDGLKAGVAYRVTARAKDDGTTVCTLSVTGLTGGTGWTDVSTTTNAYETLEGVFTTAAGALDDNVIITLITVTNGQLCEWDHVAVFEESGVPTPGALVDSSVTQANDGNNVANAWGTAIPNVAAAAFTVPGEGYFIVIDGWSTFRGDAGGAIAYMRLLVSVDGGATTDVAWDQKNLQPTSGGLDAVDSARIHYILEEPVPGSTYSYTLEAHDNNSGAEFEETDASSGLTGMMLHRR
jgi:hypothetical protein